MIIHVWLLIHFPTMWYVNFRWYDGERIEIEFMRCIHFLISCLNKHIKRGSFPHCKGLYDCDSISLFVYFSLL